MLLREEAEEGLQDDVEDRDEDEVEYGGEHHAADDGGADRVTSVGPGACGEIERHDSEDEGDRGHEDRTQPKLAGNDGSFDDVLAQFHLLLGELDDENRVLGREADEHDETDLHIDVVRITSGGDERESPEDGHRNGEQDDERQGEALILRG